MSEKIQDTYQDMNYIIDINKSPYNKEKYGDVNFSIIQNKTGLYSERHMLNKTSVSELTKRCKNIISSIHKDEDVKICNACGFLYTTRNNSVNCEQSFPWSDRHIFTHGMEPRYKSVNSNNKSKSCIYSTGFIFDTVHIITHLDDVNPIFTDEELVNNESLVMTKGYEKDIVDGSTRSYEEIQMKYDEIKGMNISSMDDKERKEDLLNILDWIQKRRDRFNSKGVF